MIYMEIAAVLELSANGLQMGLIIHKKSSIISNKGTMEDLLFYNW